MPPLAAIALVDWFFYDFPAPLFGAALGRLVSRTRIPQPLYFALLASVLMIGVSLPRSIQEAGKKHALDRAIANLNRAIELDPKVVQYYESRGEAYGWKGDLDRAIADLNKAIELYPHIPYNYALRGGAYGQKGDLDRAIADLNKANELLANDSLVLGTRGRILEALGRKDEAIADFRRALAKALGRKDHALGNYGRGLMMAQDPQEFKDALRRLGASP